MSSASPFTEPKPTPHGCRNTDTGEEVMAEDEVARVWSLIEDISIAMVVTHSVSQTMRARPIFSTSRSSERRIISMIRTRNL